MYQGCTKTGTEHKKEREFGTDIPLEDPNGKRGELDQTRPAWPWRGTEQTASMRNGRLLGPERTGVDRT